MLATLTAIFFIFGLIIGSFLNVVILRYNTARTFGGRSACMSCQNTLSWHELIPLLSFVILGGRCKNCQTKISWQYPAVELLTGVIFALLFLKFQDIFFLYTLPFALTYAYYGAAFSLLIVVAVYDLKHKIIPDMLAFIFGILAFLGLFFFTSYGFYPHLPGLWDFLAGPLIAFPFAAIWFLSRGTWMGLGDAKLAVGLGWLLGLSRGLSGVVVAFWSGAVLGALLIALTKKYGMKSEIPFAPFLVLGAVIAFLFELHLFPIF
ncbi:hypothetical protein A3G53_02225 [Candidatus Nomurabacteria bacterium RIFCSPLOWO2_12_FULL_44_11]|uniref:Peptidase A24A N-terminal domain-containing protein n=1 Tax=Candidatus Nomurabacteria bacterium RIFCSPLOWO2_12_FULL_44_11 TaxID=1801796 RepID=A0A1F6Y771_9BACT|nr:MAG: hypothetical protein A3G53_02225 [Candidatus Nomurabacteria bacterium RIFCSPLOWO2_12_FULL_44_11]